MGMCVCGRSPEGKGDLLSSGGLGQICHWYWGGQPQGNIFLSAKDQWELGPCIRRMAINHTVHIIPAPCVLQNIPRGGVGSPDFVLRLARNYACVPVHDKPGC